MKQQYNKELIEALEKISDSPYTGHVSRAIAQQQDRRIEGVVENL